MSEIDVEVTNICARFDLCVKFSNVDLHFLSGRLVDVEFNDHAGFKGLVLEIRNPHVRAKIYPSGKVTLSKATSQEDMVTGAKKVVAKVKKYFAQVKFRKFRIYSAYARCQLPFHLIDLNKLYSDNRDIAMYDQENQPSLVRLELESPKATLSVFYTGKVIINLSSDDPNVLSDVMKKVYPKIEKAKKMTQKKE